MRVHHIGYLVKKLDKASSSLEKLGWKIKQSVVRDESRGIDIVFLEKDGCCLELVSPYNEESVVSGLISRMGNSPYHFCYEVGDIESEIEKLRDSHFIVSSECAPAPACAGRRVAFLVSPHIGIIELLEKSC